MLNCYSWYYFRAKHSPLGSIMEPFPVILSVLFGHFHWRDAFIVIYSPQQSIPCTQWCYHTKTDLRYAPNDIPKSLDFFTLTERVTCHQKLYNITAVECLHCSFFLRNSPRLIHVYEVVFGYEMVITVSSQYKWLDGINFKNGSEYFFPFIP